MMDNKNLSIDDILSSLSSDRDKDAPQKAWSMAEIDELLGISPSEKNEEPAFDADLVSAPVPEPEPELEFESEPEEIPEREEPKEAETFADLQSEELPEEQPKVEEAPKPKQDKLEKTRVFDSKIVKVKAADENTYQDLVREDEDPEEQPKVEEAPSNNSTVIMELANDEVPAKAPETPEELSERKALAGKTVGIYPIRNENIDHQIITEKVEKSVGVIETDKYRERFMNKPKQKLERTADYERLHPEGDQGPIERPGIIIKKSKFTNTADLEPIPTIVSADAELNNFDKTIVAQGGANTIVHAEDEMDGQIKLSGFGEEEEIEQIDEDHAEETLKEKRDQKVASFKLDTNFDDLDEEASFGDEEEEESLPVASPKDVFAKDFIDDEYETPEDAGRISDRLNAAFKTTGICAVVQAVITVVALILTGIVSSSGGNSELIGNGPIGCGLINIVLLVLASICGAATIIRGINGIKNKKPNVATGTLIVVAACLLENLAVVIFASEAYITVSLYTAAACAALAISSFSKWIVLYRTKGNFEFITNGTQLYSSEKIADEDEAFEIGRGLLIGEPEIAYNSKITMPHKFIENSFEDDPADDFASKLIYVVLGAAVIAAIVFGIVKKDPVVAFGMFAAVCAIGIPAFTTLSSNIALFLVNRRFNKAGAAILGHRAVNSSTNINAYVLDSTDIFRPGTCSIIGIKTFKNMRIDDAILYAAALVIESGGPLADIFGNVILGKKELLPPVESLAYEEKLGLSAWIHGRRVLFGSRELLINHNVSAPEREFEMQYTHDGRKVMYLAIAGKIAAMFVIKYQADMHMRRYLQNVDRAGVSLLVRTCDCNITEEMICKYFNLPLSAVKILSPVSGDIFQKYRTDTVGDSAEGIIHNGTIEASLKTVYEARELNANIAINNLNSLIYTAMALIVFVILSVLSGPTGITGGQIVLFQVLFGAIASSIPVIRRRLDR